MSENMKLTLAIAKIGDLLLNNRITINSSGQPIDNVELRIPDYQRPYKWSAKSTLQLFDDIIEAKNTNKEVYRVGTLILHEESGKYNIVDGQQRTITFTLLLKALDDGLTEKLRFLKQPLTKNQHNIRNVPINFHALLRRVKNISDDTFGSKQMEEALFMSRSTLARKIREIYDMTPNDYLKHKRLSVAVQMLQQKNVRINEVARAVGFRSASYFTKCFKAEYGVLPADYIEEKNK